MDLTCAKCAKNYRRVENIRACGFSSRHLEDAAVVSASPSPLLHFSGDPGEVPDLIYDSRIHHFARVVRPIFLPPSPRFLAIARFETTTGSFLFSLPYCPFSLSLSLSLSSFSRDESFELLVTTSGPKSNRRDGKLGETQFPSRASSSETRRRIRLVRAILSRTSEGDFLRLLRIKLIPAGSRDTSSVDVSSAEHALLTRAMYPIGLF